MTDGHVAVDWKEYQKLVRDAERYRWLRSDGLRHIDFTDLTPDTCDIGLDYAIDMEISESANS